MWRIVTFSFTGKSAYAGTFAIEVDNSGVPITSGGNCNFASISGDAVEHCTSNGSTVWIDNTTLSGAGVLNNFPSAVEGQTYTETEDYPGTWSYTNASSGTEWRQITFSFPGDKAPISGTFVIEVSAFTGVPTYSGGQYNFDSVSGDNIYSVEYNDSKDQLDFFTDNGYGICSSFSTAVASQTYTELNPAGTWSYVIATPTLYSITASSGTNCTIVPEGTISVIAGSSKTFEMSPAQGYQISSVLVDGTSVGTVSTYTFSNVQADHTISVSATALHTYNITSTAGVGGTIYPSGTTTVYEGGSQAYSITPLEGFDINDVLVDSTSVGTVSTYTFSNVQANHTISASFNPVQVIKTYRVITFTFETKKGGIYSGVFQISVNSNGIPDTTDFESISGDSVVSVSYTTGYDQLEFGNGELSGRLTNFSTAVPNHTYTETGTAGTWSYTLGSTTTTYTIVPSAGANGAISPNTPVIVNEGSSQAFTITPSEGYKIASVLVDGTEAKQDLVNNVYTFTNVSAVHTISASFEELENYVIEIGMDLTGADFKNEFDKFIAAIRASGALNIVSTTYDVTTGTGTITITETDTLPDNVFQSKTHITSVVLPDCFTEIEDAAFAGCIKMVSITLPSTVTNLGTLVFNGCTSLGKIIVNNPTPPTIEGGDLGVDDVEVDVPYGSGEAYQNAEGWSDQNINDPKPPTPTQSYGFNLSGMKNVDYGKQGVIILRN